MSKKEVAGAKVMCTSDSSYGQPNVRAPLKSLPTSQSPVSTSTERGAMDNGKMKPTSNPLGPHHQWPYPANFNGEYKETLPPLDATGNSPVGSFEMEDNTTGSGGTSWTLRMPWLRNKRPKKQRQDDENSSIRTIQTLQSRSIQKPPTLGSNDDQNVSHYYGGLMKTTSPTFVSVGSGSIETLQGDGLYRTTRDAQSSLVLHHQHRQLEKTTSSNRRSTMTVSPTQTPRASPLDQDLLPQHNSLHPVPPTPASVSGGPSSTPSRPQHFFLGEDSTTHLQPRNNNKVFRNRSWISTSSRESNGAAPSENDSLADFDEAEWTPQDSAYGAAIPICGFVPKRLRQGIEFTLIALTAFLLVYLVVTTSISISASTGSGKHVSSNKTNSGNNGLDFDDDWYVEYTNYQNEKDDYFNDDQYMESGDGGNDDDDHGG